MRPLKRPARRQESRQAPGSGQRHGLGGATDAELESAAVEPQIAVGGCGVVEGRERRLVESERSGNLRGGEFAADVEAGVAAE